MEPDPTHPSLRRHHQPRSYRLLGSAPISGLYRTEVARREAHSEDGVGLCLCVVVDTGKVVVVLHSQLLLQCADSSSIMPISSWSTCHLDLGSRT